jgi:hypothetical protein
MGLGTGMEVVTGDSGAIYEHTIAEEETMHSFKSVITRHSEAMRRARQLLEVVEQLDLGGGGPVQRGDDVTDEHGSNRGYLSYLQSQQHQVAMNLDQLHYQRSLQASAEGGVESSFIFDGDVGRAQLYQLGYSMRSRARDPYHTPQTARQQPIHAQLHERSPQRGGEEYGDARAEYGDVRAASPRCQIADLQAQVEVLSNRSSSLASRSQSLRSLSTRLLRGKNGRHSLAPSLVVSHPASSGSHDISDRQQADGGGADDIRLVTRLPPPPRIYESDQEWDSVGTETETETDIQRRRQRQRETWKVTAEVFRGSVAHEGPEISPSNVTEREKREIARDLSAMSFQTHTHLREMPSRSGAGPDLQSSSHGGGGGGPLSRYTSLSSNEHQEWEESELEYSELEDEAGSTAEGYIAMDEYLSVLRNKGLLPQAITLHESIEVYTCIYMMYVCMHVCLYVHTYDCLYLCVCTTHTHTHTHTHTRTHIHTDTHTHAHTGVSKHSPVPL